MAYLAPEILTRQGHGRTVDLYGLGVSPGDVFFFLSGVMTPHRSYKIPKEESFQVDFKTGPHVFSRY